MSDMTINIKSGNIIYQTPTIEDWNISLIDTGVNSMTGGRLLRLKEYFYNEDAPFILTYGDGLADIDIEKLPVLDVEYYFLNLRARSVGEIVENKYRCDNQVDGSSCGNLMETSLNLLDIKIEDIKVLFDSCGIS